jgi:hypothetical protein
VSRSQVEALEAQVEAQAAELERTRAILARLAAVPLGPYHAIYVVGGSDNGVTRTVTTYTSAWEPAPSMGTPRSAACAGSLHGSLVVAGGRSSNNAPVASVEVFNGRVWQPTVAMGTARTDLACVVFEDAMYAIGGLTSSGLSPSTVLQTVERFDGRTWALVANMSAPRAQHAAAVYNGCIYAAGGFTGSGFVSSVDVFDGTRWTLSPKLMRQPRAFFGLAVLDGVLYAAGGKGNNGAAIMTTEKFTESAAAGWVNSESLSNSAVIGGALVNYGNVLYWLGASKMEVFSGAQWVETGTSFTGRNFIAAAVLTIA